MLARLWGGEAVSPPRKPKHLCSATRPHIAPAADAEFEASERRWRKGFQVLRVVGRPAPPGQQARGVAETRAMRLNTTPSSTILSCSCSGIEAASSG